MLAPHWGSTADYDLKPPTNKLEFSNQMKASLNQSVFCHENSTVLFAIVIAEINALTQPLLFEQRNIGNCNLELLLGIIFFICFTSFHNIDRESA